jgi:moderate conductance mechanosensitive channel
MNELLDITILKRLIIPILVIVGAFLIYKALDLIITRLLKIQAKNIQLNPRQQKTLGALIRNILRYSIFISTVVVILGLYGVNTAGLITSIGVFGIVIGLALQDTLRDIIAGIFILFENQYAVGDIVEITGFRGEVVSLGIKTTKIRNESGEIKIISNRNINEVINHSLNDSLAIIDINVAYESDMDHVEKVLNNLFIKLSKSIEFLKGDFNLLGVQNLDYYITYRITVRTEPMKHFGVRRMVLREIKKTFDKNNIRRR